MTKHENDPAVDDRTPEEIEADADPNNTANSIAVKTKTKTAKQREKDRAAVIGALLEQPAGREFLGWLLFDVCGLYSIAQNAAFDTNALHYREGGRVVGLMLHKLALQENPNQYMELLRSRSEHI